MSVIIEVVFCTKILVNSILVELERIMDYAGAGLERFHCVAILCYVTLSKKMIPLYLYPYLFRCCTSCMCEYMSKVECFHSDAYNFFEMKNHCK